MNDHRESRPFKILDLFENSIERVVEGSLARILPSKLQPAEIGRRLEREMMVQQVVGIDGPIAPNSFRVLLNPADATQFEGYRDQLTDELATWLTNLCQERDLHTVGPIAVTLDSDARVARRSMRISAAMLAVESGVTPAEMPDLDTGTYSIELGWHRGGAKTIALREGLTIVGRAPASDLVVEDPSVSRFHARIEVNGRQIHVRDLDSTNGTRVNGERITSSPLEAGDELRFGSVEARVSRLSVRASR